MSKKDGEECPKCGSENTEHMGPRGFNCGLNWWVCYGCMSRFNEEEIEAMGSDSNRNQKEE